jgi:hypothetical protein
MYEVTDKSTQHGLSTPHGYNTPHRYPTAGIAIIDVFADLARQLYPTGRAWYMNKNGKFDNLHKAINRSFVRVVQDSYLTLDSVFPDNDNFSGNDATLWEYRLGLITNTSLDLETRKQIILRKMSYPGNVQARQHPLFIESQLQLAGFDVWVHENTQPYQTPNEIVALSIDATQHGGITQHGLGTQHGAGGFEVIANLSTPNESYSIGSNLWSTAFLGGPNLGDYANVPANRLQEFKELVLKLKPAHLVFYTFINYS